MYETVPVQVLFHGDVTGGIDKRMDNVRIFVAGSTAKRGRAVPRYGDDHRICLLFRAISACVCAAYTTNKNMPYTHLLRAHYCQPASDCQHHRNKDLQVLAARLPHDLVEAATAQLVPIADRSIRASIADNNPNMLRLIHDVTASATMS